MAGYNCTWLNKRASWRSLDLLTSFGLVLNISTRSFFVTSKHWFALRPIDGTWFNLDSKLPQPEVLTTEALEKFLDDAWENKQIEIFKVERYGHTQPVFETTYDECFLTSSATDNFDEKNSY